MTIAAVFRPLASHRILRVERTFMDTMQMSEADIGLEVLGPMEGRTNGKPPTVGIRNDGCTFVFIADRRSFIGDTAAQRPCLLYTYPSPRD